MTKAKRFRNLKRSLLIATLLSGLAGSGAYAILQSQRNTLTGNLITTAQAGLLLSNDGTTFTNSQAGFEFGNIVPGGAAVPTTGYSFYLKNTGAVPLGIKLAVSSTPSNPSNVDLSKVNILLTTVGSGGTPQSFSLQSLVDSFATGGTSISPAPITANGLQQYKFQASMAADAFTGSSANLGNIDFAFTGIAQ